MPTAADSFEPLSIDADRLCEGISKIGEILDMGVEMGIINKSGSWFSYSDNKLGQGREAVKQLLKDNPGLSNELETKIREKIADLQTA